MIRRILKMLVLHLVSMILYFPLVIILFLYLMLRPDKMTTFFIGIEAITNMVGRKSQIESKKQHGH